MSTPEFFTLDTALGKSLSRHAERVAVRDADLKTQYTYGELDEASNALANALDDMGVGPPDRVALMMSNRAEYVVADLGVIKAGTPKVPLNDMLSRDDFEYMLSDSEAVAVVVGPNFVDTLADLEPELAALEHCIAITDMNTSLPEGFHRFDHLLESHDVTTPPPIDIEPGDPLAQYYTGGTTGKPKGVIQSHRSMTLNAYAHVTEMDISSDDRLLLMTPLPHSAGLFLWGSLLSGARAYIRQDYEPDRALRDVEAFGITWTFLVPTMIYRLLDSDELETAETSTLQTLAYGAAPMTPARLEEGLDAFGPIFLQFYGQTEVPNLITTFGKEEHAQAIEAGNRERLSAAGSPCLMAEVRIVDIETGDDVDRGEEGEILATAPYTMDRYEGRPEKTDETLVDGWVRTGDIGYRDDAGYVYLLDRESDVIITGGMNVYSTEVEEVMDEHDAVQEVAVIGIPDEEWGEAVHAVVVPHEAGAAEEHDILAFADEHLADYKKPKQIEFVDEIPKTPYGKQDKVALRDRYWQEEERQIS